MNADLDSCEVKQNPEFLSDECAATHLLNSIAHPAPSIAIRPLHGLQLQIRRSPPQMAELARALQIRSSLLGASFKFADELDQTANNPALLIDIQDQSGNRVELRLSHWDQENKALALTPYLEAASGICAWLGKNTGSSQTLGLAYLDHLAASLALSCAIACLCQASSEPVRYAVKLNLAATAVFLMSSYLAIDHARQGQRSDKPLPPSQNPPLQSADQQGFELEILHPDHWRNFWHTFKLPAAIVAASWPDYMQRYTSACFDFPLPFRVAVARFNYRELQHIASQHKVHICQHHTLAQLPHLPRYAEWQMHGPWQWAVQHELAEHSNLSAAEPQIMAYPSEQSRWCQPEQVQHSPLRGIHVIESCRLIQGPLAAQILQRLGASITKVEVPGGDPMRAMLPLTQSDLDDETSTHFLSFNYAKPSIELDIRSQEGRQKLLELAQKSDIFLHNWAPERARHLQLQAHDFAQVSRKLIYASAAGCGAEFQAQDTVGTDFMIQAYSGLTTLPASAPAGTRLLTLVDVLGAASCAEAVIATLYARQHQKKIYSLVSTMAGSAYLLVQPELKQQSARPVSAPFPHPLILVCQDAEILLVCHDQTVYLALLNALDWPEANSAVLPVKSTIQLPGLNQSALRTRLKPLGLPMQLVHKQASAIIAEPGLSAYFKQRHQHLQVLNPWSIQTMTS